MIEQFISNLFGGGLLEDIQAAKAKLRRSPVRPELLEAKHKLRRKGEVYNIAKGKICPPGKRLSKNKKCVKASLKKKSTKRKSKKVKSPKRKSKKRSTKRKSKKRSTKRKSKKRSAKRKSKKRSTKRKSKKRSTKRK